MQHVVERLDGCNRRLSRTSRMHPAGNLLKAKTSSLENHQRLNLGVGKRKASGKNLQRPAIDSDKAGSRIPNRTPKNRFQHNPKKTDTHRSCDRRVRPTLADESRPDDNFRTRRNQRSRILGYQQLHAGHRRRYGSHIRSPSRMPACNRSERNRQARDEPEVGLRARLPFPPATPSNRRIIVDHQHISARQSLSCRPDHVPHGAFFVPRRNDDHYPDVRPDLHRGLYQSPARSRAVIECRHISFMNSPGSALRVLLTAARLRNSAGRLRKVSQ